MMFDSVTTPATTGIVAPAPVVTPARVTRVAKPPSTNVWGVEFAQLDMAGTIDLADQVIQAGTAEYFITANLNYLMLTEQHPELREVNRRALAILADGYPIVRRSRRTQNPLLGRVTGADMIVELARLSAARGYRIFFLGAAPGVARAAADSLQRSFPGLQVADCYSPPFRQLSQQEHQQLVERIQGAGTDLLLVAFGQPKGELWIHQHLEQLRVPLSIQLGASFDFLAGTAKRAPCSWQAVGCEWLYRALSDPRRLGPRYAANLWFLARHLIDELKCKKSGVDRSPVDRRSGRLL